MSHASQQQSHFVPVEDTNELRELIARSETELVILFKHSLTCPISARAYRQMSELAAPVSLVVVQEARAVSREVEQLTGVPHESPQVIILRHGQPVWHASHFDITADTVAQAARTAVV
jgi:bacillithiol system protein YtxJ